MAKPYRQSRTRKVRMTRADGVSQRYNVADSFAEGRRIRAPRPAPTLNNYIPLGTRQPAGSMSVTEAFALYQQFQAQGRTAY